MTTARNFKQKDPESWSNEVRVEEQIDRLSDLPDNILEHILCLVLDSKSSVQTSILSKRWRCLWKAVPALNFSRSSFTTESSFARHMLMHLALRSHSTAVGSITLDRVSADMFDCVMQYATASRADQLHHLSLSCPGSKGRLSDVVPSMTLNHVHESLKVLKLKGFCLGSTAISSLGFKLLTTLELHHCRLTTESPGGIDPLANLPACLNYLKLNGCTAQAGLQISAPQLLVLEIRSLAFFQGVEVLAPKLKSFSLWCSMEHLKYIRQLNFPSLDHATIRLWGQDEHVWDNRTALERFGSAYINLLRGLHMVECLILCFDKSWEDCQFPFSRMKPLKKSQRALLFSRLKRMRVQYPREVPNLPHQVFRYFFHSSSVSVGERAVKFEWQPE